MASIQRTPASGQTLNRLIQRGRSLLEALPRSLSAFLISFTILSGLDFFSQLVIEQDFYFVDYLQRIFADIDPLIDIGFAPEVWLAVIGLTLGTLIIVISIAAQSIPKITELYMQDWISLIYVWFLVLSGTHILYVKIITELGWPSLGSTLLNLYIFLPFAIITALPYIFYILKSTQPENVVSQIYHRQQLIIHALAESGNESLFKRSSYVQRWQKKLLDSLNQLDDLLTYVDFKEPQADIIQAISLLLQNYIFHKKNIPTPFFQLTPAVCSDISFKTLFDQFEQIETQQTFYEQKCLRLLGNAYIRFLDGDEFDLASLCGAEMCSITDATLVSKNYYLLNLIIIRLNTMLRFAIKHGIKHNEARNLYNLAFHYRRFIECLIQNQQMDTAQQSFHYLRLYGNEIYHLARTSPALYFIVDVFAAEMKKILILVHQKNWSEQSQRELLEEMLLLDNPPEAHRRDRHRDHSRDQRDQAPNFNNGVRLIQMGLGLFYLKHRYPDFAQRIANDILEDADVLGLELFRRTVSYNCDRLRQAQPKFWEDTDRGNVNLYYSPDIEMLGDFEAMLFNEDALKYLVNKLDHPHS
ncbi:hypothetical protein L3556_00720 [Candidatus Synechococcus calcipolaris G9]|uniref:DUF2254 domain-containing protein n=1 Tax=Candidatus Synechococcus calcipolaris G9 TaxID=1497997 RepID=A0ABT6EU92_9SYNE|nr:hypothetical protein [Candidatus Synechococcus calcipolaris]MDG2989460.1 hypothetical protein [Candidatus Synechococcus calcipolaris G9]